ncbi:hypothetical protein TSUD_91440 [Trifolium subterraneum]|uniref:RecA family profile 1 domain-containing protein n=1 Tax=Trifolium subterraneum TaxID=3900 RepID=A0A2Z6PH52_TRISU|nr:hypothetical protein TSUD_91440 [Trifolium subterraneum]
MNDKGHWIKGDESAAEMLKRVWRVRPFLLPPPLHRVPLRVGNVLELVGPSPSAKTQILIQTAITCILPKHWNGIHYGGFDHLVLFIDLDSRFDINRFSQLLIYRIIEPYGEGSRHYDKALYDLCMARFLYVRCSDSFQFLQTLKTLSRRLDKEKEVHGVSVHLLMIDSLQWFK